MAGWLELGFQVVTATIHSVERPRSGNLTVEHWKTPAAFSMAKNPWFLMASYLSCVRFLDNQTVSALERRKIWEAMTTFLRSQRRLTSVFFDRKMWDPEASQVSGLHEYLEQPSATWLGREVFLRRTPCDIQIGLLKICFIGFFLLLWIPRETTQDEHAKNFDFTWINEIMQP